MEERSEQGHRYILGTRVDLISLKEATARVIAWASQGESRYVCAANVHMVMEAYDSPKFRAVVNQADLVTSDGMPLVWVLHRLGARMQERVYGPDLTLEIVQAAAHRDIPVGLYGGTPQASERLAQNIRKRYPGIRILYRYSPPFRPLTPEEDAEVVEEINRSKARILFVGLGCPKQERWMAEHKGRIQAVMLGVGAAFDLHAGLKPRAPARMQRAGLEWLFRLLIEPRRLWMRYMYHNSRFVLLMLSRLTFRAMR